MVGLVPVLPEFIDPVVTKTSPKRSFSLNRKRAFWLVFAKTGSIISGTGFFCNREAPILNSRALLCLLLFLRTSFFLSRQLLIELREVV
jgi:hypothetical protein